MKKFILTLSIVTFSMFVAEEAAAQIKAGEGQVSIALESNNTYYTPDKKLEGYGISKPSDREWGNFGSNDYLKVDYNIGRFSAGIQLDGYLPPLYGYDIYKFSRRDSKLTAFLTKYVQWEDQNWGVRLGDIYDQFGNGLIFRTYEDRALAFNNSLAGARAYYNFNNYVNVKVLAGLPRFYDVRSKNVVWGGDLALSISDMAGWNNGMISVEGSYVGRFQDGVEGSNLKYLNIEDGILNMVSGRINFETAGFTFRSEYAAKLNNDLYDQSRNGDKGNVINVDLGYSYKRFSVSATFRRQVNMRTPIEMLPIPGGTGGGNALNYVPLLNRQHTYMLANLNPYSGSATFTGGEIGGQLDAYYSLRNSKQRMKYWNFHLNFSMFNSLDHKDWAGMSTIKGRNAWVEFNFDVERQWSKKLKTTLFYSYQRRDESMNHEDTPIAHYCDAHIFVGDVTYKFNKKHSMRIEAQYLAANDTAGDWVAGLIEYNFAPKFSFYVSDMWNCEKMVDSVSDNDNYFQLHDKDGNPEYDENFQPKFKHDLLHYYQVGATYTHKNVRAQLSYGRNRAGYVCSGGACRFQPAYTGVNLALTLTF